MPIPLHVHIFALCTRFSLIPHFMPRSLSILFHILPDLKFIFSYHLYHANCFCSSNSFQRSFAFIKYARMALAVHYSGPGGRLPAACLPNEHHRTLVHRVRSGRGWISGYLCVRGAITHADDGCTNSQADSRKETFRSCGGLRPDHRLVYQGI